MGEGPRPERHITSLQLTELLAVVLAIYLSEAVTWAAPGRFVFFAGIGRFRWASGLVLRSVAPWGSSFVVERVAWAAGAAGLYLYQPHRPSSTRPLGWGRRWFAWQDLRDLVCEGADLRAGSRAVFTACSPAAARHLVSQIIALRDAKPAQRDREVERAFAGGLNLAALDARLLAVRRETRALRAASTALFAYIGALMALLVGPHAWLASWPWWLAGFVINLLTVLTLFYTAHRRLEVGARPERLGRLATMLLSFPMACKATDALTRDSCAGFHPLALAYRSCAPAQFERLARSELLLLDFPGSETSRHPDPEVRAVQDAARARLRRVLAEHLGRWGVDVARLTAAPEPEPGSSAFCPRCGVSYTERLESCADCGVTLRLVDRKSA